MKAGFLLLDASDCEYGVNNLNGGGGEEDDEVDFRLYCSTIIWIMSKTVPCWLMTSCAGFASSSHTQSVLIFRNGIWHSHFQQFVWSYCFVLLDTVVWYRRWYHQNVISSLQTINCRSLLFQHLLVRRVEALTFIRQEEKQRKCPQFNRLFSTS